MHRIERAFDSRDLQVLDRVVPVAKELTGHYFALPDDWFDSASHDIRTLKDLRQREILGEGRLAQIRKVYRVLDDLPGRVLRCQSVCPHYRICLQDHNILARLERDREMALRDLLTCVLTHEYVHLVRFCRVQHAYESREDRVTAEESRVGEITYTILSGFGHRDLRKAAQRMKDYSQG